MLENWLWANHCSFWVIDLNIRWYFKFESNGKLLYSKYNYIQSSAEKNLKIKMKPKILFVPESEVKALIIENIFRVFKI